MRCVFLKLILLYLLSPTCLAEIRLGISNAQSGPSAKLGTDLNIGSELYFTEVNKKGGINGQLIKLIKLDDGYEPHNTVVNTKKLINQNIDALFNFVGTPTSKAIMPLITHNDILFVTPFTGADFLRDTTKSNIFNLRASYEQEAYTQVAYLGKLGTIKSYAIVIQADAFGLALEKYYHNALKEHGLSAVKTLRFRRNSLDIQNSANFLIKHKVDAVLFVGTYAPLTELINRTKTNSYNPVFSTVSFISSHALFNNLKARDLDDSKVLVTEVVPNPLTCEYAICDKFRRSAKRNEIQQPNHVHFEGFLNAKFVGAAIKNCPAPISKSCFYHEMTKLKKNLGHSELNSLRTNLLPINQVYFSTLNLPKYK